MTSVVYKRNNRNYGIDTIHRSLIERLDKLRSNTLLCVEKIKDKKGNWLKYLVVKNTGEKIMLITGELGSK